jgi:hypothetical protein
MSEEQVHEMLKKMTDEQIYELLKTSTTEFVKAGIKQQAEQNLANMTTEQKLQGLMGAIAACGDDAVKLAELYDTTIDIRYSKISLKETLKQMGYSDKEENTPFAKGENNWDNTFSNEFALMQLENGGVARVSECRRIGYKAPSSSVSGFYGTKGSYQFSNAQHIMTTMRPGGVNLEEVSDYLNPEAMTEAKDTENFKEKVANHLWQWNDVSPIHRKRWESLPDSYKENPKINGHMASHQFLIDDFCRAVHKKEQPYVNAWRAARFTIPGLIAHESAKLGGVPLDIPDLGDCPFDSTEF